MELSQSWRLPEHIGSYAFRENGGAILALKSGFFRFDFDSGACEFLVSPKEEVAETRFNDGACDRAGRFWAGTMPYAEKEPEGNLYCLGTDLSLTHKRSAVRVSNGLGWSPDNKTMYYADSPVQCIFAFDFDLDTGAMMNERIFARIDQGFPDGLTVDAEGYIWCAVWDGWRVVRFAPNGSIDRVVEMPVQRPTSCIFGGAELKQLYITSARVGLREQELAKQPDAGHVFMLETEIMGLPEPWFKG